MSLKNTDSAKTESWNKPLMVAGAATLVVAVVVGSLYLTRGGKSVSTLAGELQSSEAQTRHVAARQLAKAGAQAKDAVPQLTEALKAPERTLRRNAAKTLAELGIDAKPATAALIDELADTDPDTRYYVVKALSKVDIDQDHVRAVPGLIKTLKDENPKTRYYSAKCLKSIGPSASAAIPALKVAINDADKDVKETATAALKKISKTP
jgi:HEAT repeat protein